MSKHVVQYKLHGGAVPFFIEDGGYFVNSGKLIGVTKDDTECYVPSDTELVTYHLKADFIAYIVSLTIYPSLSSVELTTQEKTDLADDWWISKGF